jgi:hypothetical protein
VFPAVVRVRHIGTFPVRQYLLRVWADLCVMCIRSYLRDRLLFANTNALPQWNDRLRL